MLGSVQIEHGASTTEGERDFEVVLVGWRQADVYIGVSFVCPVCTGYLIVLVDKCCARSTVACTWREHIGE